MPLSIFLSGESSRYRYCRIADACVVAFRAPVLQRHRWIGANGECLLLSSESVSQSPQLAAAWLDQQMKPSAIRELDRPIGRLGGAHPSVVEHVGIVPSVPTKIPTNRAATNKSLRTAANEPTQKVPVITGLFGLQRTTRTSANDEVVPLAGLEPARCCHHLIL